MYQFSKLILSATLVVFSGSISLALEKENAFSGLNQMLDDSLTEESVVKKEYDSVAKIERYKIKELAPSADGKQVISSADDVVETIIVPTEKQVNKGFVYNHVKASKSINLQDEEIFEEYKTAELVQAQKPIKSGSQSLNTRVSNLRD